MDRSRMLTLLPHGPVPSTETSCDHFRQLLIRCGADPDHAQDARLPTMERFIRFVSRFDDVKRQGIVIVALTQTFPFTRMVLQTRKEMCEKIPALNKALWVIYADPSIDPSFEGAAGHWGSFDARLDHVPFFEDRDGRSYLVLTPDTPADEFVGMRAKILLAKTKPPERLARKPRARTASGTRPTVSKP